MRRATASLLVTAALLLPGVAPAQSDKGHAPPSLANGYHPASPAERNTLLDRILHNHAHYTDHIWKAGDPPKRLGATGAYLCLLTSVSGSFRGGGERVSLFIDKGAPGGPQWTLNGTSGQEQLRAGATCISYVDIAFDPASRAPELFRTRAYPSLHSTGCDARIAPLGGEAPAAMAPVLVGLSGRFSGGAEEVRAFDTATGGAALAVKACSDGGIDGTAMGIVAPAGVIKYRSLNGRGPNARAATFAYRYTGPHSSSWGSGDELKLPGGDRWVVPADEAICGLVAVGGKFQGYGEVVSLGIVDRDGQRWWKLYVGSQALDAETSASVRCIARDQR